MLGIAYPHDVGRSLLSWGNVTGTRGIAQGPTGPDVPQDAWRSPWRAADRWLVLLELSVPDTPDAGADTARPNRAPICRLHDLSGRALVTGSVRDVHRLPEDFDTSAFVGATLQTVTFGPFVVNLTFEANQPLWIAVEGSYEHAGPEDEGWIDAARIPVGVSRLMQLTNHAVTKAARLDAERLRLDFDHGHSLTLIDDTDRYESFQIEARGRLYVV
jgi:hypothetical protein